MPTELDAGQHKDAIREMFDELALDYDLERESQFSFVEQKRAVLDMLDGVQGRVLDLGCGPALMARDLLARGLEVCGIDASPEMIRRGAARLSAAERSRCRLAVGDGEQLAFPDGYFDAVISMGVMEYLATLERAFGEARRVLKPGGVLIITVPSGASAYTTGERLYRRLTGLVRRAIAQPSAEAPAVLRRKPSEVDAELERAGFRKLAARHCNFIFFPLHDLSGRLSTALNRALTPQLSRSSVTQRLGHQYIVKGIKA